MAEPAPVDGVEIAWEDARAANRANWDERVALHVEAYGLDRYRDDAGHLSQVVRTDLETLSRFLPDGSLAGLDLCHLQCHIGTDTVSLARAGATVVGVDFSAPALAAAAALAGELGIDARWVETDVLDARAAVSRALGDDAAFDVVYTSIGAIGWLGDLRAWARQVAGLLRPGGVFYIRDGHPVLFTLDETRDELVARYRYFHDGRALQWDEAATYIGDGTIASTRTYEWAHPLSEVVTSLLEAGLTIEALEEGRTLPWRFAERMVERPDGDFEWPGTERDILPCTFAVVARRPAA